MLSVLINIENRENKPKEGIDIPFMKKYFLLFLNNDTI